MRSEPSGLSTKMMGAPYGLVLGRMIPLANISLTLVSTSFISMGLSLYSGLYGGLAPGVVGIVCAKPRSGGSPFPPSLKTPMNFFKISWTFLDAAGIEGVTSGGLVPFSDAV